MAGDVVVRGPLYACQDVLAEEHDPTLRLMARSVEWLSAFVPAAVAAFYRVDARLQTLAEGPLVVKMTPPDLFDPLPSYRAYIAGYRDLDPFAPRRFAQTDVTLAGSEDVGGDAAFARTRFAREFLAHVGLGHQVALYLRDETRIVAALTLIRKLGDDQFSGVQMEVLRRSQPLLQDAYVIATRVGPRDPHEFLRARGLTPRQVDVALLVASGAGNEEIARMLSISTATVKTHLHRVFAVLGVQSRSQLVLAVGAAKPEQQP